MPATLGHIGIQLLLSKALINRSDTKWALLGCMLPDVPWILQRIAVSMMDIPVVALRTYAIAQSSLFVSLFLCFALAMFSRAPVAVLRILGFGVLAHLLLDALQIKWGNGVVLFAPLYWNTFRWDLFWPEDIATYLLLIMGVLMALWILMRSGEDMSDLVWPSRGRLAVVCLLTILYFGAPLATMPAVERADLHYVKTIRYVSDRPGMPIEIDRNKIDFADGHATLQAWFGERVTLTGTLPSEPARISLHGHFVDEDTISVNDVHIHTPGLRDHASRLGLALVLFWWGRVLFRRLRQPVV